MHGRWCGGPSEDSFFSYLSESSVVGEANMRQPLTKHPEGLVRVKLMMPMQLKQLDLNSISICWRAI